MEWMKEAGALARFIQQRAQIGDIDDGTYEDTIAEMARTITTSGISIIKRDSLEAAHEAHIINETIFRQATFQMYNRLDEEYPDLAKAYLCEYHRGDVIRWK
jgi:hypothetical protein